MKVGKMKRNEVAAYLHRRMCLDPRFGYSQSVNRWGTSPLEIWEFEGVDAHILVGDRDCSSSVIDCWQEALRGSKYDFALASATYTGDMRRVFVNSGLFEWHPMGDGYIAETGDIYLNERSHTAMCQSTLPDELSEFLINELGTITGGEIGDQTSWESVVRPYYNFPWDGILAYNHKADGENDMTPEQAEKLDFIYNHMRWRESDHFSDLGNLVSEFPIEYETINDKGEYEPLTQPLGKRIGYIDQRVHVIEKELAEIHETLDALAEYVFRCACY